MHEIKTQKPPNTGSRIQSFVKLYQLGSE